MRRPGTKNNANMQAIADFTKMIELHPNEAIGYISRAKAYQRIGKSNLARKDNERAQGLGLKE